jgi:hypothetical protein
MEPMLDGLGHGAIIDLLGEFQRAYLIQDQRYAVLTWCGSSETGTHHAWPLVLQASFMSASVLPRPSTSAAVSTIAIRVFMTRSPLRTPEPNPAACYRDSDEPLMNAQAAIWSKRQSSRGTPRGVISRHGLWIVADRKGLG